MHKKWIGLSLIALWVVVYTQLQTVVDFSIDTLLKLPKGEHLTETIRFFAFETPKVFLLLFLVIFAVGVLRSWVTPERVRNVLKGKSEFAGNLMASFLGIITPFCTCSAIPLFLGFVEAGIPLGVTFSFLVAAPMINEVAVILLFGLFGWQVSAIYISTGLLIAITSGWILGRLRMEKYVADWVFSIRAQQHPNFETKLNFEARLRFGYEAVHETLGKIWIYIMLGIAVGAGAHGYIPENYLSVVMSGTNWYSVPLAILIGVPLYSGAAGIIPIVSVLIEKGVSLGTVLAFMMSVIGLSLPEVIILKKVLKLPLILTFVGVVSTGIVIVGYVFNLIY